MASSTSESSRKIKGMVKVALYGKMAGSTKVAGLTESKAVLVTTVIIMVSSVKDNGRKANVKNGLSEIQTY
jgi:hypothetical protein